jgi:hypothetical protein
MFFMPVALPNLKVFFNRCSVDGFGLFGQAGFGNGLAVWRPGFGLEFVDHHVAVQEDLSAMPARKA